MTNQVVPARTRPIWDTVLTIVFLVFAFGALLISGAADISLFAFTDYCPTPCHEDTGVSVVGALWIGTAVVTVAATVVSILFLTFRRRAWWVALAGWILVLVGAVVAIALYMKIIGG